MDSYEIVTKPISRRRILRALAAIWIPYLRSPSLFGALPTLSVAWASTFHLLKYLSPFRSEKASSNTDITLVTLTINPDVARLWFQFAHRAIDGRARILIADSCGRLRRQFFPGARIDKIWNFSHSRKIDYLLRHVIKSRYVWLCDDDVMIMGPDALERACNLLESDDKVAVVSFIPNDCDLVIDEQRLRGMGSYCLLLNRHIFLKEELSFSPVRSTNFLFNRGTGYYDTADYANEQLLRRGYKVEFLVDSDNEYKYVCGFDGVDSARLRLLKGWDSFLSEIKHVDVRTARHRIVGAYCNLKVAELYRELFREEPEWLPPFSSSQLQELVFSLGEHYVGPIHSQFALYDLRTEILKRHFVGE